MSDVPFGSLNSAKFKKKKNLRVDPELQSHTIFGSKMVRLPKMIFILEKPLI